MPDNSNKIKLAEQVLASKLDQLEVDADKDSVRRGIRAIQLRLAELRRDHTPQAGANPL